MPESSVVQRCIANSQFSNCIRVSRHWCNLITSQPNLWTTLDLKDARRTVKPKFIRECIRRSHGKIRNALINRLPSGVIAHDVLLRFTIACEHLQELEVRNGPAGHSVRDAVSCAIQLKILKVDESIPIALDQVSQILQQRPSLQHAEFRCVHVSAAGRVDCVVDLPNLHTLKLVGGEVKIQVRGAMNLVSGPLPHTCFCQELDAGVPRFYSITADSSLPYRGRRWSRRGWMLPARVAE